MRKTRLIKQREWKIKEPDWIRIPIILSMVFIVLYILGGSTKDFQGRLIYVLSFSALLYLFYGKYPYGWKTYYIKEFA